VAGADIEFVDVPEGAFCSDAVRWMFADGMTTGTSMFTFSPSISATRGQAAALLRGLATLDP